jgi:hypothetical protein
VTATTTNQATGDTSEFFRARVVEPPVIEGSRGKSESERTTTGRRRGEPGLPLGHPRRERCGPGHLPRRRLSRATGAWARSAVRLRSEPGPTRAVRRPAGKERKRCPGSRKRRRSLQQGHSRPRYG